MNKITLKFTCEIVSFEKGQKFSDDNFYSIVDVLSFQIRDIAKENNFLAGNEKLTLQWDKQ